MADRDARQDDPLFVTRYGRGMSRDSIRQLLEELGKRSGVSNVHAHRFRQTFAIQYLRNGGDVFALQRLLGHSSLEMVRRYLSIADTDSAEAHRRASPAQPYNQTPNPHTYLLARSKLATEWKMYSHDQCLHTLP